MSKVSATNTVCSAGRRIASAAARCEQHSRPRPMMHTHSSSSVPPGRSRSPAPDPRLLKAYECVPACPALTGPGAAASRPRPIIRVEMGRDRASRGQQQQLGMGAIGRRGWRGNPASPAAAETLSERERPSGFWILQGLLPRWQNSRILLASTLANQRSLQGSARDPDLLLRIREFCE